MERERERSRGMELGEESCIYRLSVIKIKLNGNAEDNRMNWNIKLIDLNHTRFL